MENTGNIEQAPPPQRKSGVMIFSGGMDSAAMLRLAQFSVNDLYCLTFDYGQRHKREIECAKTQIQHAKLLSFNHSFEDSYIEHVVIDITNLIEIFGRNNSITNLDIRNPDVTKMVGEAQPASYVPFRNQIFLSLACAYAETVNANYIYHGATKVDSLAGYWDASQEFKDAFQHLIQLNRKYEMEIQCPLLEMDKKAIVEYGYSNSISFKDTYTCYSGEDLCDATTPSSSLRLKGFADAGYIDPLPYKQDLTEFWEKHNCKPYHDEVFLNTEGTRGP